MLRQISQSKKGKGWLSVMQGAGGLCVGTRRDEEDLEGWPLAGGCVEEKFLLLKDRVINIYR